MGIQVFFDDNPIIAGIIVFILIAVITTIMAISFLLIKSKIKKNKLLDKKSKDQQEQEIESDDKLVEENVIEKEIDNFIYFILDFDNSGNLIVTNENENQTNQKPTKNDFLDILNNSEYKLVLPEDKVWIKFNENQEQEENKQTSHQKFITSSEIKDKNLLVFKTFVKFMQPYESPWAISKFA